MSTVTERLRQLMVEECRNSQGVLAAHARVTQAAVSKWLAGATPKSDAMITLAQSLDLSLDWLLLGRGAKRPPRDLAEAYEEGIAEGRRRVAEELTANTAKRIVAANLAALSPPVTARSAGDPTADALIAHEKRREAREAAEKEAARSQPAAGARRRPRGGAA